MEHGFRYLPKKFLNFCSYSLSGIGTIFFLFQKTAGDENRPSRRRFGGGSVGAGGEGETHSREYRLQQAEDMACFTHALLMLYSCFTHALHIEEEYRLKPKIWCALLMLYTNTGGR